MGKPTIRMQADEIRLVHEGGRTSLTFSGKLTAPEQAKLTAAVAQARTLPLLSVEAWPVERKRSLDAMDQAVRDANDGEMPAVFHRKNRGEWLVTMRLADWIELYRRSNQ